MRHIVTIIFLPISMGIFSATCWFYRPVTQYLIEWMANWNSTSIFLFSWLIVLGAVVLPMSIVATIVFERIKYNEELQNKVGGLTTYAGSIFLIVIIVKDIHTPALMANILSMMFTVGQIKSMYWDRLVVKRVMDAEAAKKSKELQSLN
jgi:hypothetical protein